MKLAEFDNNIRKRGELNMSYESGSISLNILKSYLRSIAIWAEIIALLALIINSAQGQVVFKADFETGKAPQGWQYSDKSEWCRLIGYEGSKYFRFHPFSNQDYLRTENIILAEGEYTLSFYWNETGSDNPDEVGLLMSKGGGNWQVLHTIGGGNSRQWQKDSVIINITETANYRFEFKYVSEGKYPSEYTGFDNIVLRMRGSVTGLELTVEEKSHVFPNPVSGELHYILPEEQSFNVKLLDSSGRLLREIPAMPQSGSIDLSNYDYGTYMLIFAGKDILHTHKIIVE